MSRNEAALWAYVRPKLKRYGDLERIENIVGYGTPDVNYCLTFEGRTCEGWIELKEMEKYPVKPEAIFKVDHYTQQQRLWHVRRAARGGSVHVLLRVNDPGEILLIDGATAARALGKVTARELRRVAAIGSLAAFPTPGQLYELITLRGRRATPYDPKTLQLPPE